MRALLLGEEPGCPFEYQYVKEPPYDGVVIGSLTIGELLHFNHPEALSALAEGKPVLLYTPGLPEVPRNRGLASSLSSKRRELKSWGVVFTDGGRKTLVTAEEARALKAAGKQPGPGAVLTPLAKEILEGSS